MKNVNNRSALSIPVIFEKTEDVSISDDRFTKVKVFLMHTGLNFNACVFEKDVIDDAIPTLGYIPIVGFIEGTDDDKDFSDHRYVVIKDKNGKHKKYLGNAYGVIKSGDDNNAHYEMRMCDDGVEREFLCVDGVIWNMFEDSSEIINRDLIKGHSMELYPDSVEGYEDEDNVFHFTKFSFRACCILGDDVEPAMYNSTVEVQFTLSDFVKNIQNELNDKYTAFQKAVDSNKGGNDIMSKVADKDFSISLKQQFDNVANIVSSFETITNKWGDEYPRYNLVDIQDTQAIVMDTKDYKYYGFSLTMEGDNAVVDFDSKVQKKISYDDYEDGSNTEMIFSIEDEINKVEGKTYEQYEKVLSEKTELENKVAELEESCANFTSELEEVKGKLEEANTRLEEFEAEKKAQEEKELSEKKDAEFAKYEGVLADCEEFTKLKEKKDEMSLKEIENECAILYCKKTLPQTNFSKSNTVVKAGVIDDTDDINEHTVMTKYGVISVGR